MLLTDLRRSAFEGEGFPKCYMPHAKCFFGGSGCLMKVFFRSVGQMLRWAWGAVVDFLLPPLCLKCEQPVAQNQALCAMCWTQLHFVSVPLCACCGAPFDLPVDEGSLCGACLAEAPVFAKARSALIYDDASRDMILRFKHGDRLHPAPALAGWMVQAGRELWGQADLIVPVPLHRWRLLARRYNQAAVLALAMGRLTGVKVAVDGLRRVRATGSQGHKGRKERAANVAGAFALKDGAQVEGKRIVLVDDVLTSGATVSECAKVLLKGGAAQVSVVTLARTRLAS